MMDHPEIEAATARIHAWLRGEVLRKIGEPAQAAAFPLECATDPRLIGHVPQRQKAEHAPCECGGKFYAKGMCRACWHRQYDRKRYEKAKQSPASGSIPQAVKPARCGDEQTGVKR